MSVEWIEKYKNTSQKTRFLSQLAAFIITIFACLSLYDLAHYFNEYPQELNSFIEESNLLCSIGFQVSILLIFAAKFVLLFFKKEKFFWINQVSSVIGLILFATYCYVSRPSTTPFAIYSTYDPIFKHASRSFDAVGLWYLVLSPVRHFLMLAIALSKSK